MSKKRQRATEWDSPTVFERPPAKKEFTVLPRNTAQEQYLAELNDPNKVVIFAVGPAGTGKTLLAMMAGIQALKSGRIRRLVLTRPAVEVEGERHGFLPGDLTSKMLPWTQPLIDVLRECYTPAQIEKLIADQVIELAALSYLRGRTFRDSWIVFDEAQNSSVNQMKMILTRIGNNSKMIVTGDLAQVDKHFTQQNGLRDFLDRVPDADPWITRIQFQNSQIERHPIVGHVLNLYGE